MAKKRSCRRTSEEDMIHDKAVKMRKMTDEQLVNYVEDKVEEARNEGYEQGIKEAKPMEIDALVNDIGCIKGIGEKKLIEIREIIQNYL